MRAPHEPGVTSHAMRSTSEALVAPVAAEPSRQNTKKAPDAMHNASASVEAKPFRDLTARLRRSNPPPLWALAGSKRLAHAPARKCKREVCTLSGIYHRAKSWCEGRSLGTQLLTNLQPLPAMSL
jgi:hypothetical protein